MAEPLSALPDITSSNTTLKAQAAEWPKGVQPLPELLENPHTESTTEKLVTGLRSGFERSFRQTSDAIHSTWIRSRNKFRYLSEERPLQLVTTVALAAFIAGAALRIWRSRYD